MAILDRRVWVVGDAVRLKGNLVYTNQTLPGSSGGAVLMVTPLSAVVAIALFKSGTLILPP